MENDFSWSEIGSGFGEQGCTPPSRILRSSPPPPEYCHTKNIETIGNLVYASKDERKKKREIFVKNPRNTGMSSVGARYTIKSL